jgi:DNA-binding transcriptional ArsR family regulator
VAGTGAASQWHARCVADDAPKRTRISDPTVMRALAHPARLTILEELGLGRSGTATEFAAVCGLSPSATSYHLRALAKAGLVQAAPGRGDGRERVWQLVKSGGLEIGSGPAGEPDVMRAEQELTLVWLARAEARTRNWVGRWGEETQEWYDATRLTDFIVDVTAEELAELNDKVVEIFDQFSRSRRPQPPPQARTLVISYRTVPLPEKPEDPV